MARISSSLSSSNSTLVYSTFDSYKCLKFDYKILLFALIELDSNYYTKNAY